MLSVSSLWFLFAMITCSRPYYVVHQEIDEVHSRKACIDLARAIYVPEGTRIQYYCVPDNVVVDNSRTSEWAIK